MTYRTPIILLSLTVACGFKSVGDLETESGRGSGESSGDEDSSSSASAEDTGLGACGVDVCAELPPIDTSFSIDNPQFDMGGEAANLVEQDVPCTIESISDGDPATIVLSCMVEPEAPAQRTVEIESLGIARFNLDVGSDVLWSHERKISFWIEDLFTIASPTGQLIIGAVLGGWLGDDWFAPVTLSPNDTACDIQPCGFGGCSGVRAVGIEVEFDGDSALVFDHDIAHVSGTGQYQVRVGTARTTHEPINCSDLPGRWYSIVVSEVSEG